MKNSRIAFRCLLLWLLASSGCGWMPGQSPQVEPHEPVPGFVPLGDVQAVRQALLAQYRDWEGVPYRMGGTDRRGLDCSGFAQLTYRQRFGLVLPRDTSQQRALGAEVPLRQTVPGDLLFFNTGVLARHVGIYLGENLFLHVSTRAGVMLSSLEEGYWAGRFKQAVRITSD